MILTTQDQPTKLSQDVCDNEEYKHSEPADKAHGHVEQNSHQEDIATNAAD